jgi:peptidoglycan hydrolase-like protein with peptidoglycan-binding domain
MKLQTIFGVLTIATGLLGGSFTHPAIAKRCCDSEAVATLGASAQIAHSIPPQQTSPIVIATAYTDLTLPTLRQGDRGRDVQLLQRILQDNGFLGAAGVRLGNPRGAIVDGIFGAVTASAVRDLQRRYRIPVTGRVNPTTWEVLDMHENPYRSPLPWKQQNITQPQATEDF